MLTDQTSLERGDITLQELIEKLHVAFAGERVNVDEVQSVMESYKSKREDYKKFELFDPYK